MRKATLTFSISTDTRVEGRYFGDLRVNGRQHTQIGDADKMAEFLADVRKNCAQYDVTLTVTQDTLGELAHLTQ